MARRRYSNYSDGLGTMAFVFILVIVAINVWHWILAHLWVVGGVMISATVIAVCVLTYRSRRNGRELQRRQADSVIAAKKYREEQELRRLAEEKARNNELRRVLLTGINEIDAWPHYTKGERFEKLMAAHFRYSGASVKITRRSGDRGGDLVITRPNGEVVVAQLKCYAANATLSNSVVQETHYAISYYNADKGLIIVTCHLSKQARDDARRVNIEVWERERLIKALEDVRNRVIAEQVREMREQVVVATTERQRPMITIR